MDFQGFVQKIDVGHVFTPKQAPAGGELLTGAEDYQTHQPGQEAQYQGTGHGGINLPRNVKRDYSQPVQVQAGFNIPPPAQPTSPTQNSMFVQQAPAYSQPTAAYAQPQQQFQPFATPAAQPFGFQQPQPQFAAPQQQFAAPQQQFAAPQPASQFTFQQAQAQQNRGGFDDMLDFNSVQNHAPQQQQPQRVSPKPNKLDDMDGLVDLDNIGKTTHKQYGKANHISRSGF